MKPLIPSEWIPTFYLRAPPNAVSDSCLAGISSVRAGAIKKARGSTGHIPAADFLPVLILEPNSC